MCGGAIIVDFIPRRRGRRITASDLWPNTFEQAQLNENDISIRKGPWIREEDKWMPRLVKRARTASESRCSNWTQVKPECFSSINASYKIQVQEMSGWSLNAEILPQGTDNEKESRRHNNIEKRLKGKRKTCDLDVNLDNNLEFSWQLFTETLDEEDSDGTSDSDSNSDSDSDSDSYSGPSC